MGFSNCAGCRPIPGERGEARKALEISDREGKTLFRWISSIRTSSALWSPDSKFLAVNDSPGSGGDQLWIFSLDPVAKRAVPIREPDGKKLRAEIESRHGSFLNLIEGVTLRAGTRSSGMGGERTNQAAG
ncbi:MAG: hypothetical protein K8R57_01150 [Verrucomicrobia bacterium]|nr:hypothetical protein [Verrucomicrobiota bacterium]